MNFYFLACRVPNKFRDARKNKNYARTINRIPREEAKIKEKGKRFETVFFKLQLFFQSKSRENSLGSEAQRRRKNNGVVVQQRPDVQASPTRHCQRLRSLHSSQVSVASASHHPSLRPQRRRLLVTLLLLRLASSDASSASSAVAPQRSSIVSSFSTTPLPSHSTALFLRRSKSFVRI